jgi:peptidyl-prolyl cis-trans isomerase SurA
MLKRMLGAFACSVALLTATAAPAQTMFRPVAVVNDSAITGYDLAQRAQIMVALGFSAASADALRAAALDRLIEDRLKLQAAKRAGLSTSPEQIAAGIEEFAQNAGLSADEFRVSMSAQGVTEQALTDLVSADIVWRDLVRGRFARRVEPGEAEIDGEIALFEQRAGVAYRIAEIGLPLTDAGRSEAETLALAERLSQSLNDGGDFDEAVRTYSRSPSAARGGEVGLPRSLGRWHRCNRGR